MTPPLKVLFVSDLNAHGNAFIRFKTFQELGCELRGISIVPSGGDDRGFVALSPLEKIAWKLGFPLDSVGAQRQLLTLLRSWKPDILWIEKGNTMRPDVLAEARALAPAAVIVSFSPDDMFARHNRSWYYTWGLKHYDVVFTTKSYNADAAELPALGARCVVPVDNFYDARHFPIAVTDDERKRFGAKVGFIGTYEEDRFSSMLFLAEHGIDVRVWGNGWEKKIGCHPNLRVEGKPLMNQTADLLYTKGVCSTLINLGFLRRMNRDLQTDRSVVIPACGAFLLAERSTEHLRLFTEGVEAEYFQSNDELLEKTRYYLEHEAQRAAIAAAGRRRCLESGYSLTERMRFMLAKAIAVGPRSRGTA